MFFIRRIAERLQDAMLGFAVGVMMAASVFSLIFPGLEPGALDQVIALARQWFADRLIRQRS